MSDSESTPNATFYGPTQFNAPAVRLRQAWEQGQQPELTDFLREFGDLAPERLLLVLLIDQEQRWRLGQGPTAEDYRRQFPPLLQQPALVWDLIDQEILLRQRLGPAPVLAEFTLRFPAYTAQLAKRFAPPGAETPILSRTDTVMFARTPGAAAPRPRLAPTAALPAIVGNYEVLELLGRGSMGVVYKARDLRLKRLVALKMVLAGEHSTPDQLHRFRQEAEAVARLQHPNIVQIHEVGEDAGRPFLVLEYIEGGSLAQRLVGRPLPPREAAQLVHDLASATEFAHQQGILHRDLKPANVLLGSGIVGNESSSSTSSWKRSAKVEPGADRQTPARIVPKITDFGIAKSVGAAESQTQTGEILGTPNYMSPEQAGGHVRTLGPAADIHALGAILYEMLTGRPPFQGETALDTLLLVRTEDPIPPTRLQPKLPRDLQTICLKCLQKDPTKRYASAAALAADLWRFLHNEPILARPVGALERTVKWVRRRPAAATLLIVLLLAAACVFGVSLSFNRRLSIALANESHERQRAEGSERTTRTALDREAAALATAQRHIVRLHLANGLQTLDEHDAFGALVWFAEALRQESSGFGASEAPDREQSHRLRLAAVLRRCPRLVQQWFLGPGQSLAMSPNGQWLALLGGGGTTLLESARGAALHPLGLRGMVAGTFAAENRWVAGLADGRVAAWEVLAGRPLWEQKLPGAEITGVFPSGDQRRVAILATRGGPAAPMPHVYLLAAATGQMLHPPFPLAQAMQPAALSPDGSLLATTVPGTIALWDLRTGQKRKAWSIVRQPHARGLVAFSPRGGRLAITDGNQAWMCDATTGAPRSPVLDHPATISVMTFHPDGETLATGTTDGYVRCWEATTGQLLRAPLKYGGPLASLDYSPDGRRLAAAGANRMVLIWDTASGALASPPLRQSMGVFSIRFFPEGRRLLAVCMDGSARLWDLTPPAEEPRFVGHRGKLSLARFRPDGQRVVTSGSDGTARIWDVHTGQLAAPPLLHPPEVRHAEFSPDGERVVTVSADGSAMVWDAATGSVVAGPIRIRAPNRITRAQFSPDGRRLLLTFGYGANVFDLALGRDVAVISAHDLRFAAISADGLKVATATGVRGARIWSAAHGELLCELPCPTPLLHITFSPDGRRVATAAEDGVAQLWDAATGKPLLAAPLQHASAVRYTAFSPDNRRILTVSDDSTTIVWDVASGQAVIPPFRHSSSVVQAMFDAQGERILTLSQEGVARLWDARTGEPLGIRLDEGVVRSAEFSRDGQHVVTASEDGIARLYELTFEAAPAERLVPLTQLLAGHEVLAESGLMPLSSATLHQLWDHFQSERQQLFEVPAAQALAWHARETENCLAVGQRAAALLHLDQQLLAQPNSAPLHWRRGQLLAQVGNNAEALAAYRRTVALDPANSFAWWACGRLASRQAPLAGAEDFRKALEYAPATAAGYLLSSLLATALSQPAVADGAYRKATAATEFDTVGLLPLTRRLPTEPPGKDYDRWEAIEVTCDEEIVNDATNAAVHRAKALVLAVRQRYAEAANEYTKACERAPKDAESWFGLATCRAKLQEVKPALASLNSALGLQPHDVRLLRLRASLHLAEQRWQAAADDCSSALALAPLDTSLWHMQAVAMGNLGQWQECLSACAKAIPDPKDANVTLLRLRAIARAQLRQWEAAEADFCRAVDLGLEAVEASVTFGNLLAEAGQWDRAAANFARVMDGPQAAPLVRYLCAVAYLGGSRYDAYEQLCDHQLQQAAANPQLANDVAWLCTLHPSHRWQAGAIVQLAESAVAATPKNPAMLNTLGGALYRAGRFAEAATTLEQSIRQQKEPGAWDWILLAMAQGRLGNRVAARQSRQKAAEWIKQIGSSAGVETTPRGLPWNLRVELDLLCREADQILAAQP